MLTHLCSEGDLEGVKAALQSGVDVNSRDALGYTGLMRALWKRHTAVASLLLEQEGIDVNIVARGAETALHEAARHNKTSECLTILLARPDLTTGVNQKDWAGQTPLSLAVSRNAMMCVQLLLRDGRTDANIKDDRMGATPLMLAVKTNHVDCVELLLADPRVDLMTRDNCKRSKAEVSRW